ncbi:MAG: hypothetical protein J6Z49_05300 [Kiritimatiellae bacterium]|nr:hypothetical protein [Kiritimatiellia bacterium]
MKRRRDSEGPDLFVGMDADGHAERVTLPAVAPRPPYRDGFSVGDVSLISSPLVDETKEWLSARALTLGNMLSSERAVEYVAILRALAVFRAEHEPEPLHEDVERKVCGEDAEASASVTFKADIHQLKEWNLVTERIEKERLRGYRDNRRAKFRYRMCDDAAAFVEWLEDRHAHDLMPSGGDETGNLLDMQRSILSELRRMLHRVDAANVGYETAGDVLFRVDQVSRYVDATAKTLQELNLRLLSFGIAEFSAEEAKPIVDELAVFLERFGRRFGTLREDILRDVEEMRRDCHAKRWKACADTLAAETSRFRHIASVKIPDAQRILADASLFYGAGGTLVSLMSRIGDSARKVWGKLNAKLRELERRNHRIEDVGARLAELACLGEGEVPHHWLQRFLEPAAMCGDAQVRPNGEKSVAPLPKRASNVKTQKIISWITPRKVGERPDVASIAQERAKRLKDWMDARGIYPSREAAALSGGTYSEFGDFANLMQIIEHVWLGGGEKARKLLNVRGTPTGEGVKVSIDTATLEFEDIMLERSKN